MMFQNLCVYCVGNDCETDERTKRATERARDWTDNARVKMSIHPTCCQPSAHSTSYFYNYQNRYMCIQRGVEEFLYSHVSTYTSVHLYWNACNVIIWMYLWRLENMYTHRSLCAPRCQRIMCQQSQTANTYRRGLQAVLFFGVCASHAPVFSARTPIKPCRILLLYV